MPSTYRHLRTLALVIVLGLTTTFVASTTAGATPANRTTAASKATAERRPKPKPRPVSPLKGTINVSAAASLTESFTYIAKVFHFLAPGVTINLNFGGSQVLVGQVEQGAPVDVIATADEASMRKLSTENLLASDAFLFAHNKLTMLVGKGNPKNIRSLSDLGRPDVSVALCALAVPCGKYGAQILANAKVTVTPKSLEDNVKGVVFKVAVGEVDAGITYVTDALAAASSTDLVRIADENNVITAYPIAVPRTVRNDYLARVFILFMFSPLAQNIMAIHGFMRA
ncbi:MAG: molybdate ABC transporter substrate-binding protein [Acidimicrobiales bacterium]